MGITFDFVDFNDRGLLESKLKEGKTKLVWLETPTNPTLKVSDVAFSASLAHKYGAMLAVGERVLVYLTVYLLLFCLSDVLTCTLYAAILITNDSILS